jgi:hypothetical protein
MGIKLKILAKFINLLELLVVDAFEIDGLETAEFPY